jgi:hypothetical protein
MLTVELLGDGSEGSEGSSRHHHHHHVTKEVQDMLLTLHCDV